MTPPSPTAIDRPTVEPPFPADDERARWRALGAIGWVALLVALVGALHRLGTGTLTTPPLLDRAELQRWLDQRDAVTAAFALVRVVALVLGWYLLVVTVIGLAARLTRIPALVRLADLATLPAVRRLLATVAGIGLTTSAAALMAGTLVPGQTRTAAVAERVVLQRLPDDGGVVLRRLPDSEGTATMRVEGDAAPSDPAAATEWTVRPGDHVWHIAEQTLIRAWGRAPTDAEIAPHWQRVVETNRAGLPDPSNPDLLLPGHVIHVPPPPPPPGPTSG